MGNREDSAKGFVVYVNMVKQLGKAQTIIYGNKPLKYLSDIAVFI